MIGLWIDMFLLRLVLRFGTDEQCTEALERFYGRFRDEGYR